MKSAEFHSTPKDY